VILVALIFMSPWIGGVLDRVFGKEGLDRRKKAVLAQYAYEKGENLNVTRQAANGNNKTYEQ
jgi:hypothetical protein